MWNFQRIAWPLFLVLAFSAGAAWHLASAQEAKPKVVQKWEYHYGAGFSKENVKQMGEDGWELVTATAPSPSLPGDLYPTLYFKRPK